MPPALLHHHDNRFSPIQPKLGNNMTFKQLEPFYENESA
jgi:hypothetical protein